MPTNPTIPSIGSPISRLNLAITSVRLGGAEAQGAPSSYAPVGSCFTFANDAEASSWTTWGQCMCAADDY